MTSRVRFFCFLLFALAPHFSFAQVNEYESDSLSTKLTVYQAADKSGELYVGKSSNQNVDRIDPQVEHDGKRGNWVLITSLAAIGWSVISVAVASQYEDDAKDLIEKTTYRDMSEDEYHRRRSKIKSKQSDRNFWYVNALAGALIGTTTFALWYNLDF